MAVVEGRVIGRSVSDHLKRSPVVDVEVVDQRVEAGADAWVDQLQSRTEKRFTTGLLLPPRASVTVIVNV
jgi:hypothetical protein